MERYTRPGRVAAAAACLLLPSGGAALPVAAQEPPAEAIAERCAGPEHRQFDFWLGRWEVRNPEGDLVGHNEITRVASGCGLLERWRGVRGSRGVSVNGYDADGGVWTQRWIGAGAALWLEGRLEDDAMVLTGTAPRATPDGEVLDRIRWTPLPDGRVRQVWEVSADEGGSWREIFVGLYAPPPGAPVEDDPEEDAEEAAAPSEGDEVPASGLSEQDVSAIRAVLQGYATGWHAEDPQEAILSLFVDDAVLLPHHGAPQVEGTERIRRHFWPAGLTGFRVNSYDFEVMEIAGEGRLAYSRGRYAISFSFEEGGEERKLSNEGNYVMLFKKSGDEWKIAHYIWNDPLPREG